VKVVKLLLSIKSNRMLISVPINKKGKVDKSIPNLLRMCLDHYYDPNREHLLFLENDHTNNIYLM